MEAREVFQSAADLSEGPLKRIFELGVEHTETGRDLAAAGIIEREITVQLYRVAQAVIEASGPGRPTPATAPSD